MSFNQNLMDDLIVVPAMTLNPKKAKKKLKKAAAANDNMEETQLPVNNTCFDKEVTLSPLGFSLPPQQAQRPSATKSYPKNRSQVRSVPAPTPASPFRQEKVVFEKPVPKPQTCAAQALATSDNSTKRSWFDITEEDDDDFLGINFTSLPQVVA